MFLSSSAISRYYYKESYFRDVRIFCTAVYCNAFNLLGYLTNSDASILVYNFLPERTGFNMYAEYTRPQLTFLALVPLFYLSTIKTLNNLIDKDFKMKVLRYMLRLHKTRILRLLVWPVKHWALGISKPKVVPVKMGMVSRL